MFQLRYIEEYMFNNFDDIVQTGGGGITCPK